MKSTTLDEPKIDEEIQERYHSYVLDLLKEKFVGVLETHFEKGRIVRVKRHENCYGIDPNWAPPQNPVNLLNEHFDLVSKSAGEEFFGIIDSYFDTCGIFFIKKHQTYLGKDIVLFGR